MEWHHLLPPYMEMMVVVNSLSGGTILQASQTFREVTGYGKPRSLKEDEESTLVNDAVQGKDFHNLVGSDEVRLEAFIVEEDWPLMERVLAGTVNGQNDTRSSSGLQPQPSPPQQPGNDELALERLCRPAGPGSPGEQQSALNQLDGVASTYDLYSTPSSRPHLASFSSSTRPTSASAGASEDPKDFFPSALDGYKEGEDPSSTKTTTTPRTHDAKQQQPQHQHHHNHHHHHHRHRQIRVQCRLVTEGGSQLWIAWMAKRRGHLVFLSGTLIPPQGSGAYRRHSLAEQDGQRLARSYLASAAAAAAAQRHQQLNPYGSLFGSHRTSTGGAFNSADSSSAGGPPDVGAAVNNALMELAEDEGAGQVQRLEEQRALVNVLAELFPGVMIARLSFPDLVYTFANSAFCLRFAGELKRHDSVTDPSENNKVVGRRLAEVRGEAAVELLRPHIESSVSQGRQVSFQARVPPPPPLPPYMFTPDADQEEEMQATLLPDIDIATGKVRGLFEVIQTSAKSERRLTAEELEYQAHITQTITQNAASCLFMMDHKGFPTFMNLAAERVTGYTLDEIKGKPLHYAVHWKRPDNTFYPMEECPIDNSTAELVAAQEVEEVFVRKDGSLFPVICAVAPLSKGGRTVGAVVEFRDVTEERRRENERLQAVREAEEHQRRRAAEAEAFRVKQERFIDTICHEIRNPINGIYGNVTLLQDELATVRSQLKEVEWASKPQVKESLRQMEICVDAISTCAKHQKVITDDVLHLSKLEANKIELNRVIFNPMEIINSAASMFMSQIQEKRLTLRVKEPLPADSTVPDPKPALVVRGDPDRFMQVVVNLISNSIKFTHRGGITVSVAYAHRPPSAELATESEGQTELWVEVNDTGIGMSKEEQSRIFDRFSQASHKTYREYGGSGLGLSISKGLVNLMGGALSVRSKSGSGSTFYFNVVCGYVTPHQYSEYRKAKETQKLKQAQRADSNLADSNKPVTPKRILVAEDNSINKRVIMRFLERRGHYCEAADNGEEALGAYLENLAKGRHFDLIFMDIEMPVMDGMSATKLIRERERALQLAPIPIIGLSGNSRKQQVTAALDGGMTDYVTKPYEQHTIYQKIDQWAVGTGLRVGGAPRRRRRRRPRKATSEDGDTKGKRKAEDEDEDEEEQDAEVEVEVEDEEEDVSTLVDDGNEEGEEEATVAKAGQLLLAAVRDDREEEEEARPVVLEGDQRPAAVVPVALEGDQHRPQQEAVVEAEAASRLRLTPQQQRQDSPSAGEMALHGRAGGGGKGGQQEG